MQAQRVAKRGEFGEDDLLSFTSPEKKLYRTLLTNFLLRTTYYILIRSLV